MDKTQSRRDFLRTISVIPIAAALPGWISCDKDEERKRLSEYRSKGMPKYLILDSGHGGNTTGTVFRGHQIRKLIGNDKAYGAFKNGLGSVLKSACEDEVAYDVLSRVYGKDKEKRVYPIIWDEKTRYNPIDNLGFSFANDDEFLRYGDETTRLTDAKSGIKDRIKLINRYYNALVRARVSSDNIYFVSIHAYEAPSGRTGAFAIYPVVRPEYGGLTAHNKSKRLEERIYRCFKDRGLAVKRGYAADMWGLFRSLPKQKVILEIGNMSDIKDFKSLNKEDYREKIAEAIISLV